MLADEREIFYIAKYNTYSNGYNMTEGGGGSLGRIGFLHSIKTKEQMKKTRTGANNSFYGKKHTAATKKKQSDAKKDKNNPMYGKKRPKHSEKMKGENNPMYGKKHTAATKKKQSDSHKGKLIGSKNPAAKQYILYDTKNNKYIINGNLIIICKGLNISAHSLKKNINKVVEYNRFGRGNIYKNTIGWRLNDK